METQKEKPKYYALALILREAGYSWESAYELVCQIDALDRPGCRSDDVASALLAWRRAHGRNALRAARVRCKHVLDRTNNGNDKPYNEENVVHEVDSALHDVAGQLGLFDPVDDTLSLVEELAKEATKVIQRDESW